MANKTYSPREAAIAVLKKAEELYKESSLAKGETGHEKGVHTAANFQVNRPGVSHAGISTRSVGINESKGGGQDWQGRNEARDRQKKVLNEMKAMPKPNLGKAEPTASPAPSPTPVPETVDYDPYTDPGIVNKAEHQPHPGPTSAVPGFQAAGQAQSEAHLKTPQGDAERQAGNAQRMKGHLKLAKFTGRMAAKRESMAKSDDKVAAAYGNTSLSPDSKREVRSIRNSAAGLKGASQTSEMKGVHPQASGAEKYKGQSPSGKHIRDQSPGYSSQNDVKPLHSKVLSEMKQMPKPKLPG